VRGRKERYQFKEEENIGSEKAIVWDQAEASRLFSYNRCQFPEDHHHHSISTRVGMCC